MTDPLIQVCNAYVTSSTNWKWVLFFFFILLFLSAPEGYQHWKRQKRLDKYFGQKSKKQKFKK